MPSFRVCLSVLLTALLPMQHVGLSVVAHSATTTITAADITYDGAIGTGGAPHDQYTYGSVTGRKVSGVNHFYMYQESRVSLPLSTIASATSSSVFTVASGNGSLFRVGQKIHVLRAANRPGALSDNSVIAAIASDTLTVSPALGGTPAANDFAYEDPADWIAEYVDPGTWNTDYLHATNASYTNYYQDPYQGHRMGWDATGKTWAPYMTFQIPVPAGLYYNQANGLMYYSYFDYYEASSIHNFNLGAVDLATGTNYGPWRTSYTNGDGVVGLGAKQCQFFESDPVDSTKMICGAGIDSNGSVGATPWGPNYIERAWPTPSTPAGFANPDLAFSTDGLNFYNMMQGGAGNPTSNYFRGDGSIHGVLRSMQYPNTTFGFVWEDNWQSHPVNTANRAHNGGYNTWSEQDRTEGLLDFRGAYKSGVIFVASLVGKNGGDNIDCTLGAHEWYCNAGVGRLNCEHGCTPSCNSTGPCHNAGAQDVFLLIFNTADIDAVKARSIADYAPKPVAVVDLAALGVKFGTGQGSSVGGFYQDGNDFYIVAHDADDRLSPPSSLIHKFTIKDAPLPWPIPFLPSLHVPTTMLDLAAELGLGRIFHVGR